MKLAALLAVGHGFCLTALAQSPAGSSSAVHSNLLHSAKVAPIPLPPPISSPAKSPVDLFRELLAKTPAERRDFLAARPPENRRLILAKVREYESLKPDVRELRLRVTELRWYLWPLMIMAPTNRPSLWERVPREDRKLVADRLQEWDNLPAAVQKELLENEATLRYFTELQDQTNRPVANLSPARRQKLEEGVRQWQALPEDQRQKMMNRFNQFFGLTAPEKERALKILSETERRQIEKTLRSFGQLPPAQRIQCLRSFEKFASLSTEERAQFLKNAERWRLMTPAERQSWRELVDQMTLIPQVIDMQPRPPLPLRLPPSLPRRAPAMATN